MNVTERSRRWLRDFRLLGGFELKCCLALSYLFVLKTFPNESKNRNFRCVFSASGIAPCVGTDGTVHMRPTLDAALLYVVHWDGVTTTSSRAGTDLGRSGI